MSELESLKRRLQREISARKQAESILEEKALELYQSNQQLKELNQSLEATVAERTRELAESKEQFQSLVESAGDIIYNGDANGYCTYVNPVAETLLGYAADELIGEHFTTLVRNDRLEALADFYTDQIREQRITSYYEFPAVKKDGSTLWLGQRIRYSFDSDGKLTGMTAVARDIHELREARKALQASEEKYRGIIEGLELGLLEVDLEGRIVKAYDWFCDMLGYTQEELVGKDPVTLFVKPDSVPVIEAQQEKRERGQAGVYEIELRRKDGTYIWVAISGAPYHDTSGQVIGSIGIHLDITHQKELQAELEAAKDEAEDARQAETEFLAHMSHEIRTPLNAVVGMANLLGSTPLNTTQKEYLQDLTYAADVLHGLISDVLDISKIEAGEVEVVESDLDLHQMVAMLCKALDYRARDQGNVLQYRIADSVPQHVIADRTFLNQILLNLIGNALKFTKDGAITVTLDPTHLPGHELSLRFVVSDTGIGIAPDRLDNVFERFQQEDANTRKKYGGSGLGLSISRHLVELHGGTIRAESTQGKGSRFIVDLPVKPVEGILEQSETPATNPVDLSGVRVLVAEDSHMNQKYIMGLLDQWGANTRLAKDGQEATELSRESRFDLILMDMQMPVMDGYEATAAIRKDPGNPNQKAPILALTASALLDEKRRALSAGMDDHLTKPFRPNQLREMMVRHLDGAVAEVDSGEPAVDNPFQRLSLPKSISVQELMDFYGDDLEYAQHMVATYLETFAEEMQLGEDALAQQDVQGVIGWLHRIKPSFTMVGLSEAAKQTARLESDLKRSQDLPSINVGLRRLFFDMTLQRKHVEDLGIEIDKALAQSH